MLVRTKEIFEKILIITLFIIFVLRLTPDELFQLRFTCLHKLTTHELMHVFLHQLYQKFFGLSIFAIRLCFHHHRHQQSLLSIFFIVISSVQSLNAH
jgi:hypothetical protein